MVHTKKPLPQRTCSYVIEEDVDDNRLEVVEDMEPVGDTRAAPECRAGKWWVPAEEPVVEPGFRWGLPRSAPAPAPRAFTSSLTRWLGENTGPWPEGVPVPPAHQRGRKGERY